MKIDTTIAVKLEGVFLSQLEKLEKIGEVREMEPVKESTGRITKVDVTLQISLLSNSSELISSALKETFKKVGLEVE